MALVNPFAPIEGYPNKLVARPMKPSVTMEIQMMFNEGSLSITSTRFKDFVIQSAPALFGDPKKEEVQTRAFKSKRVLAT